MNIFSGEKKIERHVFMSKWLDLLKSFAKGLGISETVINVLFTQTPSLLNIVKLL